MLICCDTLVASRGKFKGQDLAAPASLRQKYPPKNRTFMPGGVALLRGDVRAGLTRARGAALATHKTCPNDFENAKG
jgi:hypothetical protein